MDSTPFRVLDAALDPHPSWWRADPAFQSLVRRLLAPADFDWLLPQLEEMGSAAAGRVDGLARLADKHGPTHRPFDELGHRVDQIVHHPAYRQMEEVAYGSGMVALKYQPDHRAARHVLGYALGYLFAQAESGLYCPLCMTDGVARVIERHGDDEQRKRVIPRLAARDLSRLWRGAMFLTEKQGGSDVGATATRAVPDGARFRLYGEKWFCSNVDAEAILTLARPDGAAAGTRGLGLFLVVRDRPLAGLRIERIKDKLGVRSMATGEVSLDGVEAERVGPIDHGFKAMTDMLNLSRLYNAVASVAIARRAALEATRYLRRRRTFGRPATDHPLVREALADQHAEQIAATHLAFQAALHLDRADSGSLEDARRVRLLTPLAKYSTAKSAVWASSEAIEHLGGNGYVEDFPTARLLRDAQVLPVWEGTTNILLLDALRACRKDRAHELLLADLEARCAAAPAGLAREAQVVGRLASTLGEEAGPLLESDPERQAGRLRRFCDRLVTACCAALLIEAAGIDAGARGLLGAAARRLVRRHLEPERDSLAEDNAALVEGAVLEG